MSHNRAGRPKSCRRVTDTPRVRCFKPQGVSRNILEEVVVSVDELEAIRLADFEGLYQAEAAEKMQVSRQTFGRILESAHKKIAGALVEGKSMVFDGGVFMKSEEIREEEKERCVCSSCGYEVEHRPGVPCRGMTCVECGGSMARKGGCGAGRRRDAQQ